MTARKKPLQVPTTAEIETLLRSFSNAPTSVRNRALVAVLWRCGLRVGEALALTPADLDCHRGTLQVLRGKGAKFRVVGVDAGTQALIDAWISHRDVIRVGGKKIGRKASLFCTLGGGPLEATYVRAMLRRKVAKLRLPHVHPHSLRHAFAIGLVEAGVNPAVIQRALGHSSLATTSLYLDGLNPADVVEACRGREWEL